MPEDARPESALRRPTEVRVATEADLDGLTATLTAAFAADPLWSWAFPDAADLAVWWRFCIRSALRFPWVRVLGDLAAAAVWIPPGAAELTEDEEAQVSPLLRRLVGPRAGDLMELLERFEESHPEDAEHYYLSLLGTRPDRRGQGLGMSLLEENLARIDAEGVPAYLESSNPQNDARYERLGFRQIGEFTTPDGARRVATMWRDVGGSGARTELGRVATSENVAVVIAAYDALAERGLDGFIEFWADDLDHRSIIGAPDDRGPLHGRAAFRAYVQDWIDTFDGFRIEPVELIDVGENTVAGVLRYGGRARLSGVVTDSTFGVVFWIRDGKIARGREYATREEALEAAGVASPGT